MLNIMQEDSNNEVGSIECEYEYELVALAGQLVRFAV